MKHLISIHDLSPDQITSIFSLAGKLKQELKSGIEHHILKGKTLGMIFLKSSTRTRVSFETGMYQLGGNALFLSSSDIQLGRGETIRDTAGVLSRYLDGIMIRTYKQSDIEELAEYASIPVINGLTDLMHPCQALADIFTLFEIKGTLKGLKVSYVGDGNNVAHSLLHICAKLGLDISVATPSGCECDEKIVQQAQETAESSRSRILITNKIEEAVWNSDLVYTDTWVSMGQESEKEKKYKIFSGYQVTTGVMSMAKPDAVFMHCLPAYRGYEVSEEVIDGPQSVVFDQAENRLHVQKAVMALLMGNNVKVQ